MKKASIQIVLCAVALIAVCVVCRLAFFRSYSVYIPISPEMEERFRQQGVSVTTEGKNAFRPGEAQVRSGYLRIPVYPEHTGQDDLYIGYGNGDNIRFLPLRVGRFHSIYDECTGGFTGDSLVLAAVTVFWLYVSFVMARQYFRAKGTAFYAYATIYSAGFSLFSLVTGLVMLGTTARHILRPADFNMLSAYGVINSASSYFMLITAPLILCFAVAMGISNAALLRHERPRVQNALGLLVSALLIAGEAVGWYLCSRDFSGSEWEGRVQNTLNNTYATVFVYFECMLAGSMICGVKAAKNSPELDKDFIIILGCWFRKDGTLPPLLRGRVDKALSFWRAQKDKKGKEAFLIPSGGQGRDEPMAEAQAMRRYLMEQGIPEHLILAEDQSQNTYQNMAFSRKIIQEKNPEGKTVYATTNYHVFRSGVWAAQAGLNAEGMGSQTKWWYWPNAFMRETVGLLQRRWKQEILLLVILLLFFGALSLALG